jgi:site-specific DNA recombinase
VYTRHTAKANLLRCGSPLACPDSNERRRLVEMKESVMERPVPAEPTDNHELPPSAPLPPRKRRIAFYARTSSDDQRDRETIKTQIEALFRVLELAPGTELVAEFYDDGVSGTIPMELRPRGGPMLAACRAGQFDEVWVTRPNRIGRKTVHILNAVESIRASNVEVVGLLDAIDTTFMLTIKAAVAEEERRVLLENSSEGMNRAARDGRYTGGIVALGYTLEERGRHLYYALSDEPMWNGLTEAQVAARIFERLGNDGWSCAQIAMEFHTLGIPTVYQKDRRGIRGKATQPAWRANRIYSIAKNTIYRGEVRFGRVTKRPGGREIISGSAPRLVSDELWYAAQDALRANRRNPFDKRSVYLLRSLLVCNLCGQKFGGVRREGRKSLYRCGGQGKKLVEVPRCRSKALFCDAIDEPVRADLERWLRDPGDLLDELWTEVGSNAASSAVAEAEREVLRASLRELDQQERRTKELHVRGTFSVEEMDHTLHRIHSERRFIENKLHASAALIVPDMDDDLLADLRAKLDTGLSPEQWQEIAGLLVEEIRVNTEVITTRTKRLSAIVKYRFPSVVESHTGSRCRRCRSSRPCRPRTGC